MNLVGKIFVVLIFVMSLVFMSFAVAVYATHENWRQLVERPGGLKSQIEELKKANEALKSERDNLNSQIAKEKEEWNRVRGQLETAKATQAKQIEQMQAELKQLAAEEEQAVAALNVASQNLEKLTGEVATLRQDIVKTQDDRDKRFDTAVKLQDQIHQTQGEYQRIREREVQLAQQVAKMRDKLRSLGTHEDAPTDPVKVTGKVLQVNTGDMIEVDLGTDDGIRSGVKLEVFRDSKYVARVEVLTATTDKAVAKVVPGFKTTPLQKGDNVATRFKG
jgi:septal ring factor EnvC (AmiA/AmiB activator)